MDNKRKSYSVAKKLEIVKYANQNSGEQAAKKFKVDPKQVREWKKQEESLKKRKGSKMRLGGGGRKSVSIDMENDLIDWILALRVDGHRVSRNMICIKALSLFPDCDDAISSEFKASNGWIDKFIKRNGFSLRRRTTMAQKNPEAVCEKLASYIAFVSQLRVKHGIEPSEIIAMDETSVSFDQVASTTIDRTGIKDVTIKTTGHEKDHFTVILAAKGDGTKLKPFVIFKRAIREVKRMQGTKGVEITTHPKGVINDEIAKVWLDKVLGKLSFKKRMLAWDSCRTHISKSTKDYLKSFNVVTAVIPGGCTKYIQAPDVSWNKPFKDKLRDIYADWMINDKDKPVTKGGNPKAPPRDILVEWVKAAWDSLSPDLIKSSFKCCALSVDPAGSEDHKIHCLKLGQPCRQAWGMLVDYRDSILETPIELDEEEEPIELLTLDDSDDENEIIPTVNDSDDSDERVYVSPFDSSDEDDASQLVDLQQQNEDEEEDIASDYSDQI